MLWHTQTRPAGTLKEWQQTPDSAKDMQMRQLAVGMKALRRQVENDTLS
jgi:hypothetical protein